MIVRRYGTTVQSVDPNFDARALTEIGFRRSDGFSMSSEEFEEQYEEAGRHELSPREQGAVKDEVERAVLSSLLDGLRALEAEAGDDVLLVENDARDYPKTRDRTQTAVEGGENRMRFTYTVDPPLRVGVYRERSA